MTLEEEKKIKEDVFMLKVVVTAIIITVMLLAFIMPARAHAAGLLVGSSDPSKAAEIEQNVRIIGLEREAEINKLAIEQKIDRNNKSGFYVVGDLRIRKSKIVACRIIDDYEWTETDLDKCNKTGTYKQWSACWSGSSPGCSYYCARHKYVVEGAFDDQWYVLYMAGISKQKAIDWMDKNCK